MGPWSPGVLGPKPPPGLSGNVQVELLPGQRPCNEKPKASPRYFLEKREAIAWQLSFPASNPSTLCPKLASPLTARYSGGGTPSSRWNRSRAPNAISLSFLDRQPPSLPDPSFDISKDWNLPQPKIQKCQAARRPPAAALPISLQTSWGRKGPVLCSLYRLLISIYHLTWTKTALAKTSILLASPPKGPFLLI